MGVDAASKDHPLPPYRSINPAGTSSAYRASAADGYVGHGSDAHGSIVVMETSFPPSSKNRMSSGIVVFFIQKLRICSLSNTKSIP